MDVGSPANIVYPRNYYHFCGESLNLEISIACDRNPNQAGLHKNKELNR